MIRTTNEMHICTYTCISLFYIGLDKERLTISPPIELDTIIIPIVVIPSCLLILVILIIMIICCKKSRKSVPKSPSESVSMLRCTVTFLIQCVSYTIKFKTPFLRPILFSEIMLTYGFLFITFYYICHQNGGRSAGFRFLA